MKPYHFFALALTLLCSVIIFSGCLRNSSEMRGEPGTLYKCEYLYTWESCPGSPDWWACNVYKTPWGAHFRMEGAIPEDDVDKQWVNLWYYELKPLLERNNCPCLGHKE